jgi:NAD(P)-dependent dehydrogenase (short-subunit alcohol dehydrogenase family)
VQLFASCQFDIVANQVYLQHSCDSVYHACNSCASSQIVVGGSSGIGLSVCEEFLRAGAKVQSLSRSATTAHGAQHIHCDLSNHSSVMAAAAAVSSVYGEKPAPISLVLNAGHHKSDSAFSVTQESMLQHLNINVVSQV